MVSEDGGAGHGWLVGTPHWNAVVLVRGVDTWLVFLEAGLRSSHFPFTDVALLGKPHGERDDGGLSPEQSPVSSAGFTSFADVWVRQDSLSRNNAVWTVVQCVCGAIAFAYSRPD